MKTRQITVGFDVEVNPQEIAIVLAQIYGNAVVGEGIPKNGLPFGSIYVANKKRKRKKWLNKKIGFTTLCQEHKLNP